MLVHLQRRFCQEFTEYKVIGYDVPGMIVPITRKELEDDDIQDEIEARVIRLFKRKIAEEIEKDIRFEISTCEIN